MLQKDKRLVEMSKMHKGTPTSVKFRRGPKSWGHNYSSIGSYGFRECHKLPTRARVGSWGAKAFYTSQNTWKPIPEWGFLHGWNAICASKAWRLQGSSPCPARTPMTITGRKIHVWINRKYLAMQHTTSSYIKMLVIKNNTTLKVIQCNYKMLNLIQ